MLSQDEHQELKSLGILSNPSHVPHQSEIYHCSTILDDSLILEEEREMLASIPCFTRDREQSVPSSVFSTFLPRFPLTTRTHHNTPTHPIIVHNSISRTFANLQLTRFREPHHPADNRPAYTSTDLSWSMHHSRQVLHIRSFLHRIIQIHPVRWPSGLRRQLKVLPFVAHQYNRWSERAWVQIPLSSIYLLLFAQAVLLDSDHAIVSMNLLIVCSRVESLQRLSRASCSIVLDRLLKLHFRF
jgi:hypothetical protein